MKKLIRNILIKLRIPITKNISYDILTIRLMKKVLKNDSNCIDVGGFKGEILNEILNFSPDGNHYIFEPIPEYYVFIKKKFSNTDANIFNLALSEEKGESKFNYVVNYPAYSGLKKREYPSNNAETKEIVVQTDTLDNIIPGNLKIDFIKIDVEGAELLVLKGGVKVIKSTKPIIIFEFGLGASDYYGVDPKEIFEFFNHDVNFNVSLIDRYIAEKPPLSADQFSAQYFDRVNYYFIAYPK